jgi:predicted dithiol-disulfide oxidoreductase (DUF899 family)
MELVENRRQLIVYHFMFDPSWDKGCPDCTSLVNALGDLSLLSKYDTTFVVISRAHRLLALLGRPFMGRRLSRTVYDHHGCLHLRASRGCA